MKTFEKFIEQLSTEKAKQFTAFVEETGKEETFWIPNSKFEIENKKLKIDEMFWTDKLKEIQNPREPELVDVVSKSYEKGEKATKLTVEVLFNEQAINLFVWMPNSQIENMSLTKDEEDNRTYTVTVPTWAWDSGYSNAISRQLEFYNKDEEKFSAKDFSIISKIS